MKPERDDGEQDSPAIQTRSLLNQAIIAGAVFVSAYCLMDVVQGKSLSLTKYAFGGLGVFAFIVVQGKLSTQSYR